MLKEFTAHVNEIQSRVWHMIFTSYGGWQYDDGNQTNLPAASDTISANQTSYALPSSALTVRGVEVKDEGGTWRQLTPITEELIRDVEAMGEFLKTPSQPMYYQLVGESVRIFPAANYTQASSFKVFFDRASVAFESTDTTDTPGFASEYHGILPIGASLEYLKIKKPGDATLAHLLRDFQEYERKIKQFYSMRWSQMFPPRIRVMDIIRQYE